MKLTDSDKDKLSKIMKNKRKELGYTFEQVRLKLEKTGVHVARSDIQRIEEGDRKIPNPILINGLSKVYNLDPIKVFNEIGYLDIQKKENYKVEEPKTEYNTNDFKKNLKKIKVYSSIAAGFGYCCDAVEQTEEEIYLPIKSTDDVFAIKVKGDSMVPEIKDGSLIIIKKYEEILNDEIGAFYLNGDCLVKRKSITERSDLLLISENKEYTPILIKKSDDFKELGKVIGVYNTL